MRLFDKILSKKSVSDETRTIAEAVEDDEFSNEILSLTGKRVSLNDALKVSAVLACVQVIAQDFAKVRPKVIEETIDDKNRMVNKTMHMHPVAKLLNRKPNEFQTAYEFREFMAINAATHGDAYAFINWVDNKPVELLPLLPSQVTVELLSNFEVRYILSDVLGKKIGETSQNNILRLRGLSLDRIKSLKPFKIAQEMISLSMALEDSQAKLHKNGGNPGGLVSTEATLKDSTINRIKTGLRKITHGRGKYGLAVLDQGLKYQSIRMSGVDAQHLETRRFQIEEICRAYRVFPQMIMQSDKTSTYASAEAFFAAHSQSTMAPWFRRFEDAVDKSLLLRDSERLLISDRELLRGSYKDQAAYYTAMVNLGIMAPNEVRLEIGLNPIDGLDEPMRPLNMTTPGDQGSDTDVDENT